MIAQHMKIAMACTIAVTALTKLLETKMARNHKNQGKKVWSCPQIHNGETTPYFDGQQHGQSDAVMTMQKSDLISVHTTV